MAEERSKHTISFNLQGRPYLQELQGHGPHDPLALAKAISVPVWHFWPQAAMLSASLPPVHPRVVEYWRCDLRSWYTSSYALFPQEACQHMMTTIRRC